MFNAQMFIIVVLVYSFYFGQHSFKIKRKKYFHSFILTQGQHSVYPFKIKICTRKSQHIAHNLFCLASGIKFFD